MTGQQIYRLGKGSAAAKACVPLEFLHTPPKLSYDGGWIAEFWYYAADNRDHALYEPQFYLALELPGGHPVKMLRLQRKAVCMGVAQELAENAYYQKLNGYLESCTRLLSGETPDPGALEELEGQWMRTHPALLAAWFGETGEEAASPRESAPPKPGAAPAPDDMAAYWKQEMARAIREGNAQALKKAQLEMEKAKNKH